MHRSRFSIAAAVLATSAFGPGGAGGVGQFMSPALPEISFPKQHGPGRKTLHTYWKNVGASKYTPHIGAKQRAKARARLEKSNA